MLSKRYAALDDLFSECIRKRAMARVGGCERCLTPKHDIQKRDGSISPAWKQLQCSHFWGRSQHSTRWDFDNAEGLCGACHMYFHAHPLEHTEWVKQRLGERAFDMLNARRRGISKPDREAIRLYLKDFLVRMGNDELEGGRKRCFCLAWR